MEQQNTVDKSGVATAGPKKLQWYQRCVLWLLTMLMRVWTRTLRFHFGSDVQAVIDAAPPPSVIILWHNRLFVAPEFLRRNMPKRKLAALISASSDGAWLAGFFEMLGIVTIRGSRHGRATQAFREMIKVSRSGRNVGITPDGSRGPMYDMKPGALALALRAGAPVMLLSFNFSRAWRANSWDRFYIPCPFSRVEVRMELIEDGKSLGGGDVSEAAKLLKVQLDAMTVDLD